MAKTRKEFKTHRDTAVFTTKFVLEENKTITYVTHEIEDGAWQFFSDDSFDNFEDVGKVIGLQEIIELDSSLLELLDLPLGCSASRKDKNDSWIIKKND